MEDFFQEILTNSPYLGLATVLMITGMGVPLPEEIILVASGIVCGLDHANIYIMIPVGIFFTIFSDCILYFMGRKYGHHLVKFPLFSRFINEKTLTRAERAFQVHGGKALIMSRFMTGVRAAFYVSAGMFRVPLWKMIVFNGGAAVFSVTLWIWVAYYLAREREKLVEWQGNIKLGMLILGICLTIGMVIWWIRERKKNNDADYSDKAP